MKKKQKVDCVVGLAYLLVGVLYLLFPLYHINDIKIVNIVMFSIMSIISLIQFIINKNTKDYTGLFNCLVNVGFILLMIFINIKIVRNFSLCLLTWVTLEAFVKFKKCDYYNDRRDRMWKINIVLLIIFIVSGILASINLNYSADVKIIVIGFTLFINGILEFIDPIVKTLTQHA